MRIENLIFLFLNQNMCCGYSKEQSQWDGSFEHLKHIMFKLMGKKYLQFFAEMFCLFNLLGSIIQSQQKCFIPVNLWIKSLQLSSVCLFHKAA